MIRIVEESELLCRLVGSPTRHWEKRRERVGGGGGEWRRRE